MVYDVLLGSLPPPPPPRPFVPEVPAERLAEAPKPPPQVAVPPVAGFPFVLALLLRILIDPIIDFQTINLRVHRFIAVFISICLIVLLFSIIVPFIVSSAYRLQHSNYV